MSNDELRDRVRILAQRVVIGEAKLAVDKLLSQIDAQLEKDATSEVSMKLSIHVGTLRALARSADLDALIDTDVPTRLEGTS